MPWSVEQRARYYQKNKKKIKRKAATYYRKNSKLIRERVANYRKNNLRLAKLSARLSRLKTQKLSENEIKKARQAFLNHDGYCDSCGIRNPGGRGEWCIDHNHTTKTFRGILCHGCNAAIGFLKESPRRLIAAAIYIRKKQP